MSVKEGIVKMGSSSNLNQDDFVLLKLGKKIFSHFKKSIYL